MSSSKPEPADTQDDPIPDSPASEDSLTSPVSTPSPSFDDIPSPVRAASYGPDSLPPSSHMTASSTPLGTINAARHPPGGVQAPTMSRTGSGLPPEMQARMQAFHLGRQRSPPVRPGVSSPASPPNFAVGGIPSNFKMLPGAARPTATHFNSQPNLSKPAAGGPGLAQKRGFQPPGSPQTPGVSTMPGRKKPGLSLSQMNSGSGPEGDGSKGGGTMLDKYSNYIDSKTGTLRFAGKAILTSQGVEFSSGENFSISLDEVDTIEELGKGNYGTVYKVRHARPRMRRPGMGLAGNKPPPGQRQFDSKEPSPTSARAGGGTGVIMAMKELRLELDDAKFAAIIMELDVLHRCVSPHIVDFYGAFFQEGAVYICLEYMDGGSIDKLYGDGIPESVLRKITLSTVLGLKSLKEKHNIIHRDVKPTNILVNTKGQVKICDFGVSGNLVASIAKTNIGCQSYMAPERISSGGVAQAGANPGGGTYSVQSDIWSLGLTIIECGMGQYPYPPETYDNIFSQLSAIVDGEPPDLPTDQFSVAAHDFVRGCLMKIPKLRPTYAMLLQHAWLAPLLKPSTISEEDEDAEAQNDASTSAPDGDARPHEPLPETADAEVAAWAREALERRHSGAVSSRATPALHKAPLDVLPSPGPAAAAA